MGTVLKKELKIFLKRKGNFIWLFAMPIFFIVVMNLMFSNTDSKVTVQLIDRDQSTFSRAFIKQLDGIKEIDVKLVSSSSFDNQVNQLKKGNISSLVVIPKGFEKQFGTSASQVQLYRDGNVNQAAAAVDAVLNGLSDQYREQKIKASLLSKGQTESEVAGTMKAPITITTINETSSKINGITQIVPGYMIMFSFFIIMTMVTRFTTERDSGMVSRLQGTSISSWQYLLGMWLPNVFMVMFQCLVLLLFGHFVYGLVFGNFLLVLFIVISLSICGASIGIAVSMLIRSDQASKGITQLFTLGGSMLGGLWFPFDMLPSYVQAFGKMTPQYWAQHGLQEVMVHGAKISDIWPTFAVLLSIGFVGLIIAKLSYSTFLRRAVN
ncbi:ABC transporter permease [Shimazuella sp. AN120528]|uniref:ABC transporter permease n=1 Tax=Shimazuella soli TaxID=1892854 RepID=UPI001F1129E2|nr:ABC transporter permease [Shimazuella soli]MCH5583871.1 ABC transporter permease [Shimazuella soli]